MSDCTHESDLSFARPISEAAVRNVRLVLVLLAVVFVVLTIFIGVPLWVSVLCLCAALLLGELG